MRRHLIKRIIFACCLFFAVDACKTHELAPLLPDCGSPLISGYTDRISYLPGEEMQVFIQSNQTTHCALNVYDVNGNQVFALNTSLFQQNISTSKPWQDGMGYKLNAKIKLPDQLVSGVYSIENRIVFVVRSATPADILVVYPINTINAYNNSGGKSLYGNSSTDNIAAGLVSYLRPMNTNNQPTYGISCFTWFPSLTDLHMNYVSDLDMDDSTVWKGKIVLLPGHTEYWTRKARRNFDAFVDKGGHAIILSGNTMWWQVRYSPAKEVMICYKDSLLDPETDPAMKTILWNSPPLQFPILPSIGADFDHGGYGLQPDNGWDGFKIFNPAAPLLEGLALQKGAIISLPSGEYDGAPVKGLDADGFPILDNDVLKFEKLELIGFDKGARNGSETIATFIVFQKTKTSGIIVNTGSNCWCSPSGIGSPASGAQTKQITLNAIHKLLNGETVFSK